MTTNSVLIVDDSAVDTMLVSKMIKRSSYFGTIHTASNGEEALSMYRDHHAGKAIADFPPRLVLLDINMPIVNGFEFLDQFAQMPQLDTPHSIVILTSSNSPSDRERATNNSLVSQFQVKPFRTKHVVELAEQCGLVPPDEQAQAS